MRPVTASVAPQQHAGVILVRARHERASAHPMVHLQRLLEVVRGFVEPALEVREGAERPADGVERELGQGDGVLRAVRQEELVERSGGVGVIEQRAGLGEEADADEPFLVDVPVGQVAGGELAHEGLGLRGSLKVGVDVSEDGAVHER